MSKLYKAIDDIKTTSGNIVKKGEMGFYNEGYYINSKGFMENSLKGYFSEEDCDQMGGKLGRNREGQGGVGRAEGGVMEI